MTRPADLKGRRSRPLRGLALAVLSALLPGSGQLVAARWQRGLAFLLPAVAVVGVGAVLAARAPGQAVTVLLDPRALPWLLGGNLVLLVLRVAATLDAYRVGSSPAAGPVVPRGRVTTATTTAVLTAIVLVAAAPQLGAAYATVRGGEVLAAIAAADPVREADGSLAPRSTLVRNGSGRPVAVAARPPAEGERPGRTDLPGHRSAVADVGPRLTPQEQVPPDGQIRVPGVDGARWTVALIGTDAGPGRQGARADTMLVVSLDTASGAVVVFSVDRYLVDFPLPDDLAEIYAENCPFGDGWRYLNALYTCGLERIAGQLEQRSPGVRDPAATAVADTLGELLGIEVHHHALVDMEGFVRVVDALGGVELELATAARVRISPAIEGEPWALVDLPAGRQVLDGREAIAYVRMRDPRGGDRARTQRQRCLVAGALAAAEPSALVRGFPELAGVLETHLVTDVPLAELPRLVGLLVELDRAAIVSEGLGSPTYRGPDGRPDVDAIQTRVAELLADGAAAEQVEVLVDGGCP